MIDFCLLLMDFYEINLEVYVVGGGRVPAWQSPDSYMPPDLGIVAAYINQN